MVKQSSGLFWPRVPGDWRFHVSGKPAPEGGNVVSRTHQPPLTLSKYSWYSFLLSRKVVVSIPDDVFRIFHWHNPSGRTMALGLTQPLTEMSTRNISWGVKVAGAQGWQSYHIHVPIVLKSGSINLLEPSGPVQACNGIALPVTFIHFC